MDYLNWIFLVIIVAIVAVAAIVIAKIIQVMRMTPEQRQEQVKQWMQTLGEINAAGTEEEKLQIILDKFNKEAPISLKFLTKISNDIDIKQIIIQLLQAIPEE